MQTLKKIEKNETCALTQQQELRAEESSTGETEKMPASKSNLPSPWKVGFGNDYN